MAKALVRDPIFQRVRMPAAPEPPEELVHHRLGTTKGSGDLPAAELFLVAQPQDLFVVDHVWPSESVVMLAHASWILANYGNSQGQLRLLCIHGRWCVILFRDHIVDALSAQLTINVRLLQR